MSRKDKSLTQAVTDAAHLFYFLLPHGQPESPLEVEEVELAGKYLPFAWLEVDTTKHRGRKALVCSLYRAQMLEKDFPGYERENVARYLSRECVIFIHRIESLLSMLG
jgi:hypothetical protein